MPKRAHVMETALFPTYGFQPLPGRTSRVLCVLWLLLLRSDYIYPLSTGKLSGGLIRSRGFPSFLRVTPDDASEGESVWRKVSTSSLNEVFLKEEMAKIEGAGTKADMGIEKERQSLLRTGSRSRNASDRSDAVGKPGEASNQSDPSQSFSLPTTAATSAQGVASSTRSPPLPLPFFDLESLGAAGRWVERGGNFILRPLSKPGDEPTAPVGVIHFLGGAFVGAAPHITYRYLLEALADAGFVVVATPYRLDFDYVRVCDMILSKFDAVAVELAAEYGPVPVYGIGHSCGALLQTLITSLFPDAPRAANILISFNNRPAARSIPGLQEVVIPLAQFLDSTDEQSSAVRDGIVSLRSIFDTSIKAYAESQFSPAFVGKELLPLLQQALEIVDQVPPLLTDIARGTREFQPSPTDTREVCRRMYRARRTLLIKFTNDDLDESEEIEKVLREANTIMRMKRPMVEMEVVLKVMTGTHITPLTQNIILDPPPGAPDVLEDVRERFRSNLLLTVNDVRDVVLEFLFGMSGMSTSRIKS